MTAALTTDDCSAEGHARDRLRRGGFGYVGLRLDEDGAPMLVLLRCFRCESTLAIEPSEWIDSVGPRLSVAR